MAPAIAIVNGKTRPVPPGATIQTLLAGLEIDPAHVVVEVNAAIVKKELFEKRAILDGDNVEILRFVGGG